MISLEEIEQSILELEKMDTSFAVCGKLADLYTVREHLKGYAENDPKMIDLNGDNELIRLIDGKNQQAVWDVLNELFDTIEMLYPSLHESTVIKIKSL